jgi:hypothetical protein
MTLYAYLRVSTDTQDVNNQKLSVLEYCATQRLGVPELVPDTVSGKVDWEQREIGRLLARCAPGDILVVAEISRLARSTSTPKRSTSTWRSASINGRFPNCSAPRPTRSTSGCAGAGRKSSQGRARAARRPRPSTDPNPPVTFSLHA